MNHVDIIAIDGPSASGKSTVARGVARRLGYTYVNSGSLYRGIAWCAARQGIDPNDTAAVTSLAARFAPRLYIDAGVLLLEIDGVSPTAELNTAGISALSSRLAAVPAVRDAVVRLLRSTVQFGNMVIEGRDIGSVVFPTARLKFYVDASPEERARRRQRDLDKDDGSGSIEEVAAALRERDRRDSTRKVAPLIVPDGAIVVDTTGLSLDQSIAEVLKQVGLADSPNR